MPIINCYKNLILIFYLLFISCSEENQERQKITIDSTFKIKNKSNLSANNNTIFQWWIGNHPEDSDYTLEPLGDKALFTPDLLGEYDIFVSIRDSNDIEIDFIDFYFICVAEKITPKPTKIISEKALNQLETNLTDTITTLDTTYNVQIDTTKKALNPLINKTSKNNKTSKIKKHSGWTIQLSSRSSLELAKNDQIIANKNGYDAYIEQTLIPKTNKTWYRVRVGNFKNKTKAIAIQKEIKSFWENDTWIDRVKIK